MIASLSGTVAAHTATGLVLTVGGVGLAVATTPGTRVRLRVGDPASLSTTLVVREDSLTLFGFETDDERDLFELLMTSTGVGPRLAQAVLTTHAPDTVRRALATEDLGTLCLVPGVGKKGAQRMVLELKDKVGLPTASHPQATGGWQDTLAEALTGLGFTGPQSQDVVGRLAEANPGATAADVPTLLREALALLGRSR